MVLYDKPRFDVLLIRFIRNVGDLRSQMALPAVVTFLCFSCVVVVASSNLALSVPQLESRASMMMLTLQRCCQSHLRFNRAHGWLRCQLIALVICCALTYTADWPLLITLDLDRGLGHCSAKAGLFQYTPSARDRSSSPP